METILSFLEFCYLEQYVNNELLKKWNPTLKYHVWIVWNIEVNFWRVNNQFR